MTLKAFVWSVLTLAAVQLMSCQRKVQFDPAPAGAFFPLHPGFTWTYRVTDKSRDTTEIFTDRTVVKEQIGTPRAAGEVVSE